MGINNYNSTFNANVYQSERDQFINAGRNAVMNVTVVDARHAAADLRVALAATRLPPGSVKDVGRQLDEIDAGLAAPQPDRGRIARGLDRLTRLLGSAGALVAGGAALVTPLAALAHWLGAAGVHILRLLPM